MLLIKLVILTILLTNVVYAQGNITGEIIDRKTKSPLVGVNVVVDETTLGAATDEKGFFIIKDLQAGSYNIRIMYLGYETILKSNVIVNPKSTTVLKIDMEEDIFESETIEATASYFAKPKEAVLSTRSMDFEEIRRSPGSAMDIQRVMQALPAVVSGSDQNNEIIIRGGIPGENLFLMDNIEIPNPNHFGEQGTTGGPINMLNTYMVRSVDFYAGAFSAKYGDKASSVMDITLRDGNSEGFCGQGNIGMAGAGVILEGPLMSGEGNYIFSARKSFLDLIISSTGLTAVPKYYNFQGRVSAKLHLNHTLIFNGIYGNDEINIVDEGTGGYARGAENVDYSGYQYAAGISLKSVLSKDFFAVTTLSGVRSNWDVDVYRTKNKKTYFQNNSIESEYMIKSDLGYNLSDNIELNFGASYKVTDFEYDVWSLQDTIYNYMIQPGDSVIEQINPAWKDNEKEQSFKTALYSQFSWDIFKRLRFTSGFRFDYYDYNKFSSISPRFGLFYFLDRKTTLNMAYGIHYQTPSYIELTANPLNKNLENKYTEQYVLGVEKIFGEDIRITFEVFYKSYFNVPVTRSSTTPEPFDSYAGERLNKGEGYAQGIELFFQKKLTDKLSAIVSYSHSVSKAKDPRSLVNPNINEYYNWDYDYRNVFTFIGGYKLKLYKDEWYQNLKKQLWYKLTNWLLPFGDEVEFSIKFRYLGGRPYTPPVYHPEYKRWIVEETQFLNTERYPEYIRLDFRLDRRFFFETWNMVIYFDIMNILGRDNIWEYQYNENGTAEKILQFEVFPVGGVSIEF
jgi:hypothetical protein